MYRELLGEITKRGLTKKELAEKVGITEKTLRNKLNGKTDFTWSEVKKIRNVVAPSCSIEKLFEKTEAEKLN